MNDRYPHLFSSFTAGKRKVTFKHRIFSSPMHAPLFGTPDGILNEHGLRFYTDKAKGGAACVEVGQIQMDLPASGGHIRALNMGSEEALLEYHILNRYVHALGARSSFEINHEGHYAFPEKDAQGNLVQPMSACAMTMPNGVQVRAMDESDMERVAQSYANAVAMGKRAGFDMVCLHFGHGWLISAFLSPLTNHRTDQYGGNAENRMRFPKMVLQRIRERAGVELRTQTEATPELVAQLKPDAVIVAVGADPIVLPIPGVDLPHVRQALSVFGRESELGHRVVIVGGGLVGCETAIHLGNLGHEVTVLEMGPYLPALAHQTDAHCVFILHNASYHKAAR